MAAAQDAVWPERGAGDSTVGALIATFVESFVADRGAKPAAKGLNLQRAVQPAKHAKRRQTRADAEHTQLTSGVNMLSGTFAWSSLACLASLAGNCCFKAEQSQLGILLSCRRSKRRHGGTGRRAAAQNPGGVWDRVATGGYKQATPPGLWRGAGA